MWEVTTWFLEVAVLLLLAMVLEAFAERIGQPKVFAWVLAGLMIPFTNYRLSWTTRSLGLLGIITYLFYVGLEGSLKGFVKSFKQAGIVAAGGVAVSLASGFGIMALFHLPLIEGYAVGVALSATSVTVTVKTLEELGRIHGREAQVILGAAVVDDVLGLALLSTLLGVSQGSVADVLLSVLGVTAAALVLWFGVAYLVNKGAKPLYKYFSRLSEESPILTLTFIILLGLAFIADELRLSSILLAYAFGIGLSTHKYIAGKVERMLSPLTTLFTPIFFIVAASLFTYDELVKAAPTDSLILISAIIAAGFVSKVVGCALPALLTGSYGVRDSLIVGLGMVPRGEVMITVALAAKAMGFLPPSYVGLLLLLPATSLLTPAFLSRLYGGRR